ncbi:DUF378 domain-containing protein [Ureibacillus composti]
MSTLTRIALTLAIIGAINWGLIGLFNFDLVATIFGGQDSLLSRIIYSLVGFSGLICLPLLFMRTEEDVVVDEADTDVERDRLLMRNNYNYQTEVAEEVDFAELEQIKRDAKKDEDEIN